MYRADKFYGPDRQGLANISLSFFPGAKIGVIGPNGAGKSTLLRIMAGREEPSSGDARLAPGATVGLLEQEPEPHAHYAALLAEQATVQDEIDRRGAWSLDATLDRAMDALRLPDGDRDVG